MAKYQKHIRGKKPARWLLTVFSDDCYHTNIAGDCEEIWLDIADAQGSFRAYRWLWMQVLKSIPLFLLDSLLWSLIMFRNYLKTTFRHFKHHKGYAAINIVGLAIGMASTLLILMWVRDELSYDKFHEHLPQLYRAFTHQVYSDQVFDFPDTPAPLAPALESEFPEVERAISLLEIQSGVVRHDGRQFDEEGLCFARPGFFDLFTFPLIHGDREGQLEAKSTVLITQETAQKYFGDDDVLGNVLTINDIDFEITGVLRNIPVQSHLQFNFLIPFENTYELYGFQPDAWYSNWPSTYLKLAPGMDSVAFAEKIKDIIKANNEGSTVEVWMQPVSNIWLYRLTGEKAGMLYVQIFTMVAFFVLLIACINFMNLSTAKSANRSKEVGLRKVLGAFRKKLIVQFYSESVLLAFSAFVFALVLVAVGLPLFNQLSGKQMDLTVMADGRLWILFIAITLLTGIVAGSYPALVLSSFKPVTVLGRRFTSDHGGVIFRRALVIVQFTLSIALVVGTAVVQEQIEYIQNKDLGYNNKNLMVILLRGGAESQYSVLKTELERLPDVAGITATDKLPISGGNSVAYYDWDNKPADLSILINQVRTDYNYINLMGMSMAQGRDYSEERLSDIGNSYILNEEAIRRMGLSDPVGKRFGPQGQPGTIVGVIRDYHFASMRREIEPMVMMVNPKHVRYLLVRLKADAISSGMEEVEAVWDRIIPDLDFESHFLDDIMTFFFRQEQETERIVAFFTSLAIVISCLGLFGLATFMAQKRIREIGIRRVLGATTQGLLFVMTREFIVLVLISNAIAWPIAYFLMSGWLENYVYHASITWSLFVMAGIASMIIACLTVGFKCLKAALTNPAQSLRCE